MKITVAGGDLRMLTVKKLLADSGRECYLLGHGALTDMAEALENADAILFPAPHSKGIYLNAPYSDTAIKTQDILDNLNPKTLILGGISQSGNETADYSKREDFQIKNAVPTAEAAVMTAMKHLKTTIRNSEMLIIGFGRIGSYLAKTLRSLGANITVIARRAESRALAEISGFAATGFEEIEAPLAKSDIVFNTVPQKVLGERELNRVSADAVIIDLASLPGGVDKAYADQKGIRYEHALALPGKYSPVTAGVIIYETVEAILSERGL